MDNIKDRRDSSCVRVVLEWIISRIGGIHHVYEEIY